jgi:arylsulfatase A-like enzyme
MVLSPRVRAFDLEDEASEVRDAYGRNPFGQGCLLARRLVEQGVTFVEVRSNGWDMHRGLKETMARNSSQVDTGMATLIHDLKQRNLLDTTLVVWMGEFGRTPKVNPNAGRDHYPRAFNVAVAGGGIKGGQVIGATSKDGTEVVESPASIQDLLRTFCDTLKINASKENISPQGRPLKIVDGGKPIKGLLA